MPATEPETELHYICHCTVYYEIRGRFHCLFREGFGPLSRVMSYEDQGLYLLELHRYRDTLLGRARERQSQRQITDFFSLDLGHPKEQPPLQSSAHTHSTTTGILIDRALELRRSRRPRLRERSYTASTETTAEDSSHTLSTSRLQMRMDLPPSYHCYIQFTGYPLYQLSLPYSAGL